MKVTTCPEGFLWLEVGDVHYSLTPSEAETLRDSICEALRARALKQEIL
jgi:hypothetical protein